MTPRAHRRPLAICWFPLAAILASTDAGRAEPAGEEFFERSIRPVLVERCVSCHGAKAQKGGLRLDSREGALAGGTDGPVIVVGKPAESR